MLRGSDGYAGSLELQGISLKKKKIKGSYETEPTNSGKKSELGRVNLNHLNRASVLKPGEINMLREELQEDGGDFTNCNHLEKHQH